MKRAMKLAALFMSLTLSLGAFGCAEPSYELPELRVSPDRIPMSDWRVEKNISEADAPIIETARISFLAAGDNVIHPCFYIDAKKRAAVEKSEGKDVREYDFKPTYADAAELIASYDLAFINQETLMAGEEFGYSGYPTFNSPRDLAYDLIELGFDIVNIANNHMCDKGTSGLGATIDFWKSLENVTMIGGYSDAEDYESLRIVECKGVKLAFIGYTEMTNGIKLRSSEPVVPYANDEDIKRQVSAAKEVADIVIVSVHWGNENWNITTDEQEHLAQVMCDSGADVILGHHPHVLQPIEQLTSTDGEHQTLCIYSLGNLISGMASWENMVGGFFTFDIVQLSNGEVFIDSPEFIPTVCWVGANYLNSHLYFLEDYTDALEKAHGTYHQYGSYGSVEDMKAYAKKIMGDYIREEE